jgi:hypothetical protein
MRLHYISKAFLAGFILTAIPSACLAQIDFDQLAIKLNLYELTLNKEPIRDLTIEKVKDMLGDPTVSENTWMADITGPQLYYDYDGLMFWFNPKNKDSKQSIISLTIYLIDMWDEKSEDVSMPFDGNISPELTLDYKINDILPLFKDYKTTVLSAEEYRKEIEEAGFYADTSKYKHDIIRIENNKGVLSFSCEEATKFLDYITLSF